MPGPSDHLRLTGRRLASFATYATLAGAGILTVAFAHEAGASNPGTTGDEQTVTDDAGAATTVETAPPTAVPATAAPATAGAKPGTATTRTPTGQTPATAPAAKSTPSTRAPSVTVAPPATAPATVVQHHSHSGGS